jgi:hypothetical protein
MRGLSSRSNHLVALDSANVTLFVADDRGLIQTERFGSLPGIGVRPDISADGHDVVAATDSGRVALWRRGDRVSNFFHDNIQMVSFDGDRLFVANTFEVMELGAHGARPVAKLDMMMAVPSTSLVRVGEHIFVYDEHQRLMRESTLAEPIDVASDVQLFAKRNEHELVMGNSRSVFSHDPATQKLRLLVDHDATLVSLHGNESGLAAAWSDGHVWWDDGTHVHSANAGCEINVVRVERRGVEVGCGPRVIDVFAPGGPRPIVTLPKPVLYWLVPPSGPATFVTDDRALYRLDGTALTQLVPPGMHALPALTQRRFATIEDNAVYLHDVATGMRAWLADLPGAIQVGMSQDGRSVVAYGIRGLKWWKDPSPEDPVAWHAWKAQITRAHLADPMAALEWR